MSPPKRSRQAGQTLMEVLVAVVVVAVGLGYLMMISGQATERGLNTAAQRQAQILARYKLEEVILDPETPESGEFEEHPGFRWEVTRAEEELIEEVFVERVTVMIRYPVLKDPTSSMGSDFDDEPDFGEEEGPDKEGTYTVRTFLPLEDESGGGF